MTHRTALAAVLCWLLATAFTAAAQTRAQPPLPAVRLTAGIHVITAEVASDYTTRATGLMFRERLAPNHGMLFVFEDKSQQCFWMQNTPLPLTIAFIEDDGTIIQLADMAPFDRSNHCSQKPVRYALEMERGWFVKRGLAAGSRLQGLPARR
jgi:uncharacterized membrane protein (UPF0127 family)